MFKYPVLESLSVENSNLQENYFHVVMLQHIIKELASVLEDKGISMDIKSRGGHGIK